MPQHVRSKGHPRFLAEPFDQRHHRCVGHGPTDLSFPQVHKHKVRQHLNFQCTQFINQIICVKLQEFFWEWDGMRSSCFGTSAVRILITGNNLECPILNRKIRMFEAQMVNDPKLPRVLPSIWHSCPQFCTLTGKYPSKLLLEPIVMHRFCKFGSKVGSVSRTKPSPAYTGKQAGGWTNVPVFLFRSILGPIYDQKRRRFSALYGS